jgi:hypothetical protein
MYLIGKKAITHVSYFLLTFLSSEVKCYKKCILHLSHHFLNILLLCGKFKLGNFAARIRKGLPIISSRESLYLDTG